MTNLADSWDAQPEAIVRAFCAAWATVDLDRILGMLTPDAIYQNGPARPVKGREDIATLFRKMTRGLSSCNFEILHLATSGHVVFTERLDVVTVADVTAELPVAGVFEVRDGLISEWREYFDLAMHMRALSPQPNGESTGSEDAL